MLLLCLLDACAHRMEANDRSKGLSRIGFDSVLASTGQHSGTEHGDEGKADAWSTQLHLRVLVGVLAVRRREAGRVPAVQFEVFVNIQDIILVGIVDI